MNRIILSIIVGLVLTSCTNKEGKSNNDYDNGKSELTRKEFYLSKMKDKDFQIEINGPCDDALEDTIHERSVAYFDSQTLTDTNVIVEFKFIDACCQEFLGDYSIQNDSLIFKFEQVNDEMCSCLCWYRYKLTINEPKANFKRIKIEAK